MTTDLNLKMVRQNRHKFLLLSQNDYMPFPTLFQLHHSSQCTYTCFPGIPFITKFLLRHLISQPTIIETMLSSERDMNPDKMTIIKWWIGTDWARVLKPWVRIYLPFSRMFLVLFSRFFYI